MIHFKNVSKYFGLKKALNGVTLDIDAGEFVAIVGPSGSGKTTLVNLLIGAYLPTEGELYVDEMHIPSLNADDLQKYRKNIGIVFQDYQLLPKKTVHENVALAVNGQPRHLIDYIPQLLENVGLAHAAESFPHELSGGEMQRTALARALAHRPSLLIADEPTGNLDTDNEKNIMDLLKALHREGRTVILTTHNIPLAEKSGCRVIHLRDGQAI